MTRGDALTLGFDSRTARFGVTLLAALVYLNSLGNGFAQDDYPLIVWNELVQGVQYLGQLVRSPYWPNTPSFVGLYRPVTSATFAFDWAIWSGQPFGFHLTNVVLHAGVTALVFLLLAALGSGPVAATVGSAIFAVHPVHVEAVANVAGRAELLAAAFFLAACLVYLRSDGRWSGAAAIGLLYFLSMGAKEIGVMLPATLVLVHLAEGGGLAAAAARVRARWRIYLTAAAALLLHLLLRHAFLGVSVGGDIAPWFWGEPFATRIWTAVRLWPEYVRLLLFPLRLLPDYGPAVITPQRSGTEPLVLLGFLTAVVAATVAALTWNRDRKISLGILWFILVALPVSGLLFDNGFLLAERTLYLPSVGFAIGVAGAWELWVGRKVQRHRPALAVVVVVVLAGGVRTWVHNPVWASNDALFGHLVTAAPENYRARLQVAAELEELGRHEEAMGHLARAAELVPGHFNVRLRFGQQLLAAGRFDEAAVHLDAARAIAPEVEAPHMLYLASLGTTGRWEPITSVAPSIAARYPESPLPHHFLANALAALGRLAEARAARLEAIRLDQGMIGWQQWLHLALIEHASGSDGAAGEALANARAEAPDPDQVPELGELGEWVREGAVPAMP